MMNSVVYTIARNYYLVLLTGIQAFYTKFYIPEKDLYPQEVECTDKLSRALVVRMCDWLGNIRYFNVNSAGSGHFRIKEAGAW